MILQHGQKTGRFFIFVIILLMFSASIMAQGEVTVTLNLEEDALVIFVETAESVSLEDFGFAFVMNDETQTEYLREYNAFSGILNEIPAGTCLRLLRSGAAVPLPQSCDTAQTITQQLNSSDIFWYDPATTGIRTMRILRGDESIRICGEGQTSCVVDYSDPAISALSNWSENEHANDDWMVFERDFGDVTMVLVPSGCFMMGSNDVSSDGVDDENPIVETCFENAFWIDKTEVTNEAFGSEGCGDRSSAADQPRNCVSWVEALQYCESIDARLPTEAEWEYAARGPDSLLYPWGNDYDPSVVISFDDSEYGDNIAAPVGSRPDGASWVGALDMSGNLWEWTGSIYDDYPYNANDGREVTDIELDARRTIRGGSFYEESDYQRAASRGDGSPTGTWSGLGFRCVRNFEALD